MKPGSVVELKSGGPQMTITWVNAGDNGAEAYCEWFVGEKNKMENKGAVFPLHSLRIIEE